MKNSDNTKILRTDIAEEMDDFEKRMKFLNIARCLAVSDCSVDIREMVNGNLDVLINLIFAVLIHIENRSLADAKKCTRQDVCDFLNNFIPALPSGYVNLTNVQRLTNYIVVNVLQNGGKPFEFLSYYSKDNTFKNMRIRLIGEENGAYYLTDDAFDYIYRTKELEADFQFTIDRLRFEWQMKKKNYKEAVNASLQLLEDLRHMINSMNGFIRRCKENIFTVNVEEYEKITKQYKSLIEKEHKELEEIKNEAKAEAEIVKAAMANGVDTEESRKNSIALQKIILNLQHVLVEQRIVINEKYDFTHIYDSILQNSLSYHEIERMDFENDIMKNLKKMDGVGIFETIEKMTAMLHVPGMNRFLNIEQFFMPYEIIDTDYEDKGIDIENLKDDNKDELVKQKQDIYIDITRSFFEFLHNKKSFYIEDYIKSLTEDELSKWSADNILAYVISCFYQNGETDVASIKEGIVFEPKEMYYELRWCIKCLLNNNEFTDIKKTEE